MEGGNVRFWVAVAALGFLIGLLGPLVVGFQGIHWFREGYWPPVNIRDGLSVFNHWQPIRNPFWEWQGVQKLIVWVLDVPLSIGLIVLGCTIGALGLHSADKVGRK